MALSLDIGYVKSCYGILKILEFLCLLVAWACMADVTAALWRTTRDSFFLAVNVSAWLFVIIWFCCYLLMLCGKVTFGQQALIFGIIHLIWAGLLIVAGGLAAETAAKWNRGFCSRGSGCEIYEVAAAFGVVSGALFLIDGIYHLYQHQNGVTRVHGGASGGGRTVTTTKTVVKTTRTTK